MTPSRDEATQAALDRLLKDYSLAADTRLYREAMRESLTPTDAPGVYRLPANAAPSESVVDVYGSGYLMQAESVGPGLAFAESARPDWQETMEMRAMKAGRAKPRWIARGRPACRGRDVGPRKRFRPGGQQARRAQTFGCIRRQLPSAPWTTSRQVGDRFGHHIPRFV